MAIKTNLNDMVIGDKIIVQYAASSGVVGTFSNLGNSTATLIPTTSSATPNGSFYWIYVGNDFKGRKILVADRNIQHSISWDILNTAGIATKDGIQITSLGINSNQYKTNIRLLTGGTSSTTAANSEWNKYIASGTGDGQYAAGDNTIWNAGIYSWTNTTLAGSSTSKVVRGLTTQFTHAKEEPNINATNLGFRPVMVVETFITNKYLIKDGSNYFTFKDGSWTQLTETLDNNLFSTMGMTEGFYKSLTLDSFESFTNPEEVFWNMTSSDTVDEKDKLSYRILVNGVEKKPFNVPMDGSLKVTDVLSNSYFNVGDNSVVVEYQDDFEDKISTWQSTVSLVNTAPNAVVVLSPNTLHLGNAQLSATITDAESDAISYRILVNGVQVFPETGFTPSASSPITVEYTIANNLLNIGANSIKMEVKDAFRESALSEWNGTITVENAFPIFTPDIQTLTVGTKSNAKFTGSFIDSDGDKISYRCLANGIEVKPWTTPAITPVSFDFDFPTDKLNFGTNNITIEMKDDFKNSVVQRFTATVDKVNQIPNINLSTIGSTMNLSITDQDNDTIKYQVKLNGTKIYPVLDNYTALEANPTFTKALKDTDGVKIDQQNTLEVIAIDEFGGQSTSTTTFRGEYSGIMFTDINEKYFSSDAGRILRVLDFGTVVAGQTTMPIPVNIKNKNGFNVQNVIIDKLGKTLAEGIQLEISKTTNPFVPEDSLTFDQLLQYDDKFTFYVRIKTIKGSNPGTGEFDLLVKADPVQ